MEEDIKNYISGIEEIRKDFEVFKMRLHLSQAKKAKIIQFLSNEEQSATTQELLQIY